MVVRSFVGTVRDPGGLIATRPGTITVNTGAPVLVPIVIGESAILSGVDSGNAGQLIWQKVTLPAPGILESMEFWTANAAGNLRYGLYAANGPSGRPGTLIVESPSFASAASSWNKRLMTSPQQPAAEYWLAHEVSSNTMQFRSGPGGNLLHIARAFGAMPNPAPTTGILTNWDGTHFSFRATFLVDQAVLPPPPEPGFISTFVSTAANWSNPSIIGGDPWYNHHGGRPYSLTKIDDYTLQMELRQGDPPAIDVGGERSEISGGPSFAASDLIDIEFDYTVVSGLPILNQNGVAWATVDQIHGDVRPSWIGFAQGGRIFVNVNPDVSFDKNEWTSPAPLVVGQKYHFKHQVKRSPSTPAGWMKLWIDGALVADFSNIRVGGVDNYVKLGLYRGWEGLVTQTSVVRYANIKL